ncbi:hypothetical protein [uncultured Virgibacillus sp.]|uniref:hypothetical protein n=1 Tax=uncultured Virgibacillus sp. TaxID=417355 RepID=UPI00260D1FFD|nr:hypothetical protein [uncultured Virgibacillus sp.]
MTGSYLQKNSISSSGNKEFTAKVKVNIRMVFLPKEIFGYHVPSIPYTASAHGRVIE